MRRPWTDRYKDWKARSLPLRQKYLTFINLFSLLWFLLGIVLTCIRQESANEWYRDTVKDLLLPNTVNQKGENRITRI